MKKPAHPLKINNKFNYMLNNIFMQQTTNFFITQRLSNYYTILSQQRKTLSLINFVQFNNNQPSSIAITNLQLPK